MSAQELGEHLVDAACCTAKAGLEVANFAAAWHAECTTCA